MAYPFARRCATNASVNLPDDSTMPRLELGRPNSLMPGKHCLTNYWPIITERVSRYVRKLMGCQAPSLSASCAKSSTMMVQAGLGFGSGGPPGPHSSGRRTNAV